MFQKKKFFIIVAIVSCVLIIHSSLILYFINFNKQESNALKFLIDTDAGSDDAVALFLALNAESRDKNIKIIAITCTYGNTNESNVENNVLKILTVANRADVPVFGGSVSPIVKNYTPDDYFGKDGLGEFEFTENFITQIDRSKHAANAMIDFANNYPGELNIVTLGPLTNVALAMSLDPKFSQNIKQFYVMGSSVTKNEKDNPIVEFNFGLDPESNLKFLASGMRQLPIITSFDVAKQSIISKEWRTQILGRTNTKIIQFLNKAEVVSMNKTEHWVSADAIAMATSIWPELIVDKFNTHISPIICNDFQGAIIEDKKNLNNISTKVVYIKGFNITQFQKKLLEYL